MKPLAAIDPARRASSASCRGSVLMEVGLGLLVFLLAALLVFSLLYRTRQQTRQRQFEKQLQEFSAIFAEYRARKGEWPDSTAELGARLTDLGWSRGSPFGGEYSWKPSGVPGQAGSILLTAFHPRFPLTLDHAGLVEIDRHLDDGDLATGRFHTGFNGWPVYQPVRNP